MSNPNLSEVKELKARVERDASRAIDAALERLREIGVYPECVRVDLIDATTISDAGPRLVVGRVEVIVRL